MTIPVIDLTVSQPVSTTIQALLPTSIATVTAITTTTISLPLIPPQLQQGSSDSILIQRIGELEQHMADIVEANQALEERLDKQGNMLYNLENLDIPYKVSKAMDEIVTDVRSFTTACGNPTPINLMKITRSCMKLWSTTPPPPPAGPSGTSGTFEASESSQFPPPPPPPPSTNQSDQSTSTAAPSSSKTAASAEYTAWTTTDTRIKPSVSSIPEELHMEDDTTPDKQVQSSGDEDIGHDHIPMASALAFTYAPPLENSLLVQTSDMAIFMDYLPGQVMIQSDFFFNKDLEYPPGQGIQGQQDESGFEHMVLDKERCRQDHLAKIGRNGDNVQAMMDADYELCKRLQEQEQGELTIEEKSKLFMELMNERKRHFAKLRAEEKRRKPLTKGQRRNQMCTYLKNMGGFTHNQLKNKSYEEIQKAFDKTMGWINNFKPMDSKEVKSSEKKAEGSRKKSIGKKRAGNEQKQESSKRQRMKDDKETDEHEEVEEDDEAEMKKHMEIVQDKEEIAIDAIPLATKPPMIIEYKIVKEGQKGFYHLIRADGSSKRPEDDYERVFWGDLKVMFEPDIKSEVWRSLQGYKVTVWKLFDSCGVHFVRFKNLHIFMLVEKRYPLTPIIITNMLNKKLQADHWNEMCYRLLKLMTKQEKCNTPKMGRSGIRIRGMLLQDQQHKIYIGTTQKSFKLIHWI
ncbi:hypothetical protein Tco_0953151 [Tanacetum coccineum]|uniref:Uncharacterized protein n=1 Tax=Tanacetum coccineum TaxID=301880 RepID=A0ABQ5DZ19_9ASTR